MRPAVNGRGEPPTRDGVWEPGSLLAPRRRAALLAHRISAAPGLIVCAVLPSGRRNDRPAALHAGGSAAGVVARASVAVARRGMRATTAASRPCTVLGRRAAPPARPPRRRPGSGSRARGNARDRPRRWAVAQDGRFPALCGDSRPCTASWRAALRRQPQYRRSTSPAASGAAGRTSTSASTRRASSILRSHSWITRRAKRAACARVTLVPLRGEHDEHLQGVVEANPGELAGRPPRGSRTTRTGSPTESGRHAGSDGP